jgi:hypothetical protein
VLAFETWSYPLHVVGVAECHYRYFGGSLATAPPGFFP